MNPQKKFILKVLLTLLALGFIAWCFAIGHYIKLATQ